MKLKKLTSLLIPMVASLPFVAAACGGEGKKGKTDKTTPGTTPGKTTPTPTPTPTPEPVKKFNVTILDGTKELSKKEIEEKKEFTIPASGQEKSGHIFIGFFLDKEFNNEAKPGSKITITADTTIYAKYITLVDYVKLAIKNTVGDKFKYNYELNFEVAPKIEKSKKSGGLLEKGKEKLLEKALQLIRGSANFKGTISYNKDSKISYLKDEKTSGVLIKDGQNVHWIEDSKLHKFKINEKKNKFKEKEEQTNKKYESSRFAKVLFGSNDETIKNVVKQGDKFVITLEKSVTEKIKEFLNSSKFEVIEKHIKGLNDLKIKNSQISVEINSKSKQLVSYYYDVDAEIETSVKVVKEIKVPVQLKLSYKLTFATPDSEIKLPEIAQQNSN